MNALKRYNNKILFYIIFYIIFLIPSFLFVGSIFYIFIERYLWYDWDNLLILDLISPPLARTQAGAHFLLPPLLVYSIWFFFFLVALIIPAFFLRLVINERNKLRRGSK